MAVVNEVSFGQLEGSTRIDAEYYQPHYIKERITLRQYPHILLGDVAYITDGQHGYHKVDPESIIKHITAKCIVDNLVSVENVDRLSEETHRKNQRSALQEDDILLSTAGTIGNAGIVTREILPANIDQDVARICIHDKNHLSPWYVSVFLMSELGKLQTRFETTGQVQQHLSLDGVKKLLIPLVPNRDDIAQLAIQSYEKNVEAKRLYMEADLLLLHALSLSTFNSPSNIISTATFKEVSDSGRLDSEYWDEKFKKVQEKVKSIPNNNLKSIAIFSNGATPKGANYLSSGVPFLRIQNVHTNRLNLEDVVYIDEDIHKNLLKRSQLQKRDVLI